MFLFSTACRLIRVGSFDKCHEYALIITNTIHSRQLDDEQSHKAWTLRWLALVGRKMPSEQAAQYCLQYCPDVALTQVVMQEILAMSSIQQVEMLLLDLVEKMEKSVLPEAGITFRTLGFNELCAITLERLDYDEPLTGELLWTLGEALLDSGNIAKAVLLFEDRMYPTIETDDEAFALLGIFIYNAAQKYDEALSVADKMLVLQSLSPFAKLQLQFHRAKLGIKIHDHGIAIAELDSMKLARDHPDYFEYSLLRARVSPPAKAINSYDNLLQTLGVQSVSSATNARSSLGANNATSSAPSAASRDINGLEFKIRLAKLRVQLKVATSANELDALLKLCADLEWASHPKVSFIWACAAVKRAWFCVPERSKESRLPEPKSFLPYPRPPASQRMIDQVQALNASGSSLFSSAGARSGGSKLGSSLRHPASIFATYPSTNDRPLHSSSGQGSAPQVSQLNLPSRDDGDVSYARASAVPSSPALHRSRGRRNSSGTPAQGEMQKYLSLARIHFQNARDRVYETTTLVSQYHKIIALNIHAPTPEYAIELQEEAQKFLDCCSASEGAYVPKVAALLASVFRKEGRLKDALNLLDQTQDTAPIQIERLLCQVAESRIDNLGERPVGAVQAISMATGATGAKKTDAFIPSSSSAPNASSAPTSPQFSSNVSASVSSSNLSQMSQANAQNHRHQLLVNRVIDDLSMIKGRYWESAQFHAGRFYEDELGQLDPAEVRYREVTRRNPRHMHALYRLAFLRCRRSHKESDKTCSAILKYYPNDIKVLEWRAGAYVILFKYHEAVQDYSRILAIDGSINRVRRARDIASSLLTNTGFFSNVVSEYGQHYGQTVKTFLSSYWPATGRPI